MHRLKSSRTEDVKIMIRSDLVLHCHLVFGDIKNCGHIIPEYF